jgi:hypothetical protein
MTDASLCRTRTPYDNFRVGLPVRVKQALQLLKGRQLPAPAGRPTVTARLVTRAAILLALLFGCPDLAQSNALSCANLSSGSGQFDSFGGVGPQIATPTGFFQIGQVGSRKVLVTPEGHPFWMLGMFAVDVWTGDDRERITAKYGPRTNATDQLAHYAKLLWGEHAVQRLKSWGFNTLAEYTNPWYVLPTRSPTNPEKMPFVSLLRPAWYGLTNKGELAFAERPFKDLISATDPAIYTYWRRSTTPDVWDPQFEVYIDGWMQQRAKGIIGSPWLIGFATDDADNLFGFGPSAEIPAPRLHPHLGWLALIASPRQSTNTGLKVTYTDPKVYSKYAIRDWLKDKYVTIAALNSAWGATYTTWDSNGGWPGGKGLLDESGRSPWVGNDHAARKASATVQADLDEFLYRHAKRYFAVMAGKIRQYAGKHLVFGPTSLNGWGGLTHRSILKAAGEHLDVLQASTRTAQQLELTLKYAGKVPIVSWTGMVANPDSPLSASPNPTEITPGLPTQEERGRVYLEYVRRDFEATTLAGTKQIVGTKLWSWSDSRGEGRNWGVVTFLDNAYDGKEAVIARGTDPWGYDTGGETNNYGDFLSTVRQAHSGIVQSLCDEATKGASGPPSPVPLTPGGLKIR